MEEKNRFALAMRMGRAALGMSQQEFAEALGVATVSYTHLTLPTNREV